MPAVTSNLPRLQTERLIVRLAQEGDANAIAAYYQENRDHLGPWEPVRPPGFYHAAFWRIQIRRNIEDHQRGLAERLFVFPRANDARVIGYISLTNITRGAAHFCFLGYSLAEDAQGHGYMTEALRAVIDYAFTELSLHRLMANYMPRNTRSERLLQRLGFVREGMAADYLLINGRWEDHVMTSLINPHWQGG